MANVGTTVIYNGYTFPELTTSATLDKTPIFTDDGVDYLYTHCHLEIQFTYGTELGTGGNQSVVSWMNARKFQLEAPRKQLQIKLNDETLYTITPPDAKLGPFPTGLKVKQFTQKQACVCSWGVDFYVIECTENPPPLLTNRWNMALSMDSKFMWFREINGTIMVRAGAKPDAFRQFGVPKIPMGWKREGINVKESSDGLRLDYTIRDKQLFTGQPDPCSEWEGHYAEATDYGPNSTSALQYKHISLKAWGDVKTSKATLLQFLAQILSSRITVTPVSGGDFLQSANISESLNENWVAIQAVAIHIPGQKRGPFPLTTAVGANIYATDNIPSKDPGDRGTYLTQLFVAEASNNCGGAEPIIAVELDQNVYPGQDDTSNQTTPGDSGAFPEAGATDFSQATQESPYTNYEIETRYEKDYRKFHLPIANLNGNAVVVQVAQPTVRRKIKWTATRQGQKPQIPTFVETQKQKILEETVGGYAPFIGADGDSIIWKISGTFDIAYTEIPTPQDALSLGSYPLDTLQVNTPDTQITYDQYDGNMI